MAMNKTTVYLSDDLKAALKDIAAETQLSEAELIGEGIRLAIARYRPSTPRSSLFDSGRDDLSGRVDELLAGFGT